MNFQTAIDSWQGKRIAVIGDAMVDVDLYCTGTRPSNEWRTGTISEESQRRRYPGGAANVAANLKALGAEVALIAPIGDDEEGRWLKCRCHEMGIALPLAYHRDWNYTTRKTRVYLEGEPIVRLDRDVRYALKAEHVRQALLAFAPIDALALSDYQKGAFSEGVRPIVEILRQISPKAIITANPKPKLARSLPPIDLISVNAAEFRELAGESYEETARKLGTRTLLVTHGADGLLVTDPDAGSLGFNAHLTVVRSVAGAGDASFAAATLTMTVTDELGTIGAIANAAGAAKVSQAGTAPVSAAQLQGFRPGSGEAR